MHSDEERSRSDPAKVLNGTANPRIFGNGEMRTCVVVVDDIRCGLNSSPCCLATVSRLMAKTDSYTEFIISYQTVESDHSHHR